MRTVLLVEDQSQVRGVVRRMLERAGHRVIPAASAAEALRLEQKHRASIDILLTDVVLPGISGPELAIKINERRIGTRTVFMSGYPDEVVLSRLDEKIPCSFLQKPFTCQQLEASFEELFADPEQPADRGPAHV